MRFIHTSDLHLGKPFGRLPETVRYRLRDARHSVLNRLAQAAREHDAPLILIAGDSFDAETPSPEIWRQALAAIAQDPAITWVMLPGNHDSLAANELWRQLNRHRPANLVLATQAQPIALAQGATLLPAPCTARRTGRDLTQWFDDHPSDGGLRIGLAHGAITDFTAGEGVNAEGVIAPDRARRAKLDWLALGDWHGHIQIDARSAYSGTPEPDGFRRGVIGASKGSALLVEIETQGAEPKVTPLPMGQFTWHNLALECLSDLNPLPAFNALMAEASQPRDAILRLTLTGRIAPNDRLELAREMAHIAPLYGHFALDQSGLRSVMQLTDLDQIERGGALRAAADALWQQANDATSSEPDRIIASNALDRLFELVTEEEE